MRAAHEYCRDGNREFEAADITLSFLLVMERIDVPRNSGGGRVGARPGFITTDRNSVLPIAMCAM